jgi:hypothetical protein
MTMMQLDSTTANSTKNNFIRSDPSRLLSRQTYGIDSSPSYTGENEECRYVVHQKDNVSALSPTPTWIYRMQKSEEFLGVRTPTATPHNSKTVKFQHRNLKKIKVNLKRVLLIQLIPLAFFLIPFIVVKILKNSNCL